MRSIVHNLTVVFKLMDVKYVLVLAMAVRFLYLEL